MMKHTFAIGVGLATLFVVPAATSQKRADSLEQMLDQTIAALEQLIGLEQRLHDHDATAVADTVARTEPALATPSDHPQGRDDLLDALRRDVVRLQGALEGDQRAGTAASSNPAQPTTTAIVATIGLDDAHRSALATKDGDAAAIGAGDSKKSEKKSFEEAGYAADALLLGQAYFRKGEFAKALKTLSSCGAEVDATYWKARCLEKLGRTDEAIAAYEQVVAAPSGGKCAERAKDDLEFLKWTAAFRESSKTSNNGEQR
jgi:tetratricopeptide (TPR) repeat protein